MHEQNGAAPRTLADQLRSSDATVRTEALRILTDAPAVLVRLIPAGGDRSALECTTTMAPDVAANVFLELAVAAAARAGVQLGWLPRVPTRRSSGGIIVP